MGGSRWHAPDCCVLDLSRILDPVVIGGTAGFGRSNSSSASDRCVDSVDKSVRLGPRSLGIERDRKTGPLSAKELDDPPESPAT